MPSFFVTPEYNLATARRSRTPSDYLSQEWTDKAVGFVSYGGVAGDARGSAAQAGGDGAEDGPRRRVGEHSVLRAVHRRLRGMAPNDALTRSADAMLDELARITALIRPKIEGCHRAWSSGR